MATFYLDFEGGNDSNDGTTFANRWKTITSGATAARTAPGDVIRIMKSPDPVSLGVNGTFTKQSPTITLASAVTANISLCQAAWTASANVTTGTNSNRKEGTLSTSIAPAAAFTTGLLAYEATGTLDLSAYQNVTFWIRTSSAVSANVLRLDLCSDTAGATPVHSITIDTAFGSNTWKPVTWKNGSALSSSIKSVALTALSDPGTPTILIDNILATNDLHFNSLIGTSSSATNRVWYALQSINGTTVRLTSNQNMDASTTPRGYHDTTTTTTVYVRDAIRLLSSQTIQESGTVTSRITYSGGWDRTSMSSQDGLTLLVHDQNIYATASININSCDYISFERLSLLFGSSSIGSAGVYARYDSISSHSPSSTPLSLQSNAYANNITTVANLVNQTATGCKIENGYFYSSEGAGLSLSSNNIVDTIEGFNNAGNGLTTNGALFGRNITCKDNGGSGIGATGYCEIAKFVSSGNAGGYAINAGAAVCKITNWSTTDSNAILTNAIVGYTGNSRYSTYAGMIHRNGAVAVDDVSTPVHGTASKSWRHIVQAQMSTMLPNIQPLQPFAVATTNTVTFKIWVYRTSTNVEGRVRLRGYITPGVDADVTSTITAAINTWQELTVTCTPSAAGVVQIDLESYSVNGSTGTVYFGDATVSQA